MQDKNDKRTPSQKATNTSLTPPEGDTGRDAGRTGRQEASRMPPEHARVEEAGAAAARRQDREQKPGLSGGGVEEPSSRRPMKEYRDFVDAALDLKILPDHKAANEAVNAVLGVIARDLSEDEAFELTKNLPAPLNFEELRGLAPARAGAAGQDPTRIIAQEFNLGEQQAAPLIGAILKTLKGCLPEDQHRMVAGHLPRQWHPLFEETKA